MLSEKDGAEPGCRFVAACVVYEELAVAEYDERPILHGYASARC